MSDSLPSRIASERCQRARLVEWAPTGPALFRSEGFFEDLACDALPVLRQRRVSVSSVPSMSMSAPSPRPQWAGVLASALGLRRA